MKDIVIIGAGGFGREVAWLIERINNESPTWKIKGFIDDNEQLWGKQEDNYKVLGGTDYLKKCGEIYAVCAVGSASVRKRIVSKFQNSKVKFATVIDPSVIISDRVQIGEGTIICAGTIITVDVKIGNHIIGDFVTIYPSANISGNVLIGGETELGTGMQIIQGKEIGTNIIIGAGAVVVKDCIDSGTYVGNPARKIK